MVYAGAVVYTNAKVHAGTGTLGAVSHAVARVYIDGVVQLGGQLILANGRVPQWTEQEHTLATTKHEIISLIPVL
eukprot:4214909-Pyramimonas_sp.AAC.1